MAAPEGLFALEGRPTAQLIADYLREQIGQGMFRPGEQINESVLASQLDTSRASVREALQRLCQEGILVRRHNKGVFLLELTTGDIREIYAARQAVESTAAAVLVDAGQDQVNDTCRELQAIITDMAKRVAASDWHAVARLDMEFHTTFVAGAGNTRLIRIYETLAAETRMCILNLAIAYPRMDVLIQEHQILLDLLEAGDKEALHKAIKRHLETAVEDLTTPRQDKP